MLHTTDIKQLVNEFIAIANSNFPRKINTPVIEFTLTGVKAGYATYPTKDLPNGKLNFNMAFSAEKDFYHIIGHEVAHLVTKANFPDAKQHHGPEFRHVCHMMGTKQDTYHDFDVSKVKKTRKYKRVVGRCACREHFFIASTAENIRNGLRTYTCRSCKGTISVTNEIRTVEM